MKDVVARLMDEARRRAGGADQLIELVTPHVQKKDYKKQAVSSWQRGTAMPPAEVLLAACKVTGISIDATLYGEGSMLERLDRLERRLAELLETSP
jgi:transcriptional regulator with XRE-family HTH domain